MAERSSWITLDRNIDTWRWYKNANTFRVWIHILLHVNYKKCGFEGIDIFPGQIVRSYNTIADELGMTYDEVRTAIKHLKRTGEITVRKYPKFLVISVVNWKRYQTNSHDSSQSNPNQDPYESQAITNNQTKEQYNKETKDILPDEDWRDQ